MKTPPNPSPRSRVAAPLFLGVLAGIVFGVGGSLLLARRSQRAPTAPEAYADDGSAAARSRGVRSRPPPVLTTSTDGLKKAVPRTQPVEPQTARELLAEHEEQVRRHFQEPTDARWAPVATRAYADDLRLVAEQSGTHFTTGEVDCRFETCVVTVDWPSRGLAAREYVALLHFPYRAGCGRSIVIPEPPEGSTGDLPAKAHLIFDCSADKSRPIPDHPLMPPLVSGAGSSK
jgi:hypothetical protein